MNIEVNAHTISIIDGSIVNENELNVTELNFSFSEEYTNDLVKVAVFLDNDGNCFQRVIINDTCNIPYTALAEKGKLTLGVYAFGVDTITGNKTIQFSPKPKIIKVSQGSYVGIDEEITTSQFETYMQAMQDGLEEIDDKLEEAENIISQAENVNASAAKSGNVTTFSVTNRLGETTNIQVLDGDTGNGIVSISKTSTSGLTDTYTITFTDGMITTFEVKNGKQISAISKTGTSGLVDTYTVTYNDSSTSTFSVTNGRGITSISKTSTNNLIDTYTITYNDGTTNTFNVTNGAKGDKGDKGDTPDVSNFITKDVDNLTNYYKKSESYSRAEIDSIVASVYKYRDTVSTYNDLPNLNLTVGDVYNIETADSSHGIKAGDNVAWNGTNWDVLAGTIDISGKLDTSKVKNAYSTTSGEIYDAVYINGLVGDIDSALDTINGEVVS